MKKAMNRSEIRMNTVSETAKEGTAMLKKMKKTAMRIACAACAALSAAVLALAPVQSTRSGENSPAVITAEAATSYTLYAPIQDYKITSAFGWRTLEGKKEFHTGIDFISNSGKRDVYAVADATVVLVINKYANKTNKNVGFGNVVVLKLNDGSIAIYAHLQPNILVKEGQKVKKAQKIANYGTSGYALGSHLHFEMRPKKYSDVSKGVYTYYGQKYVINVNPLSNGGSVNYRKQPKYDKAMTPNGRYIIKSAVGGWYMSTAGSKFTGGTNVQLANKADAAVFIAHYNEDLDAWYFVPEKNTAVVLNCYASQVRSTTNVNLYKYVKNDSTQCILPIYNSSDKTFRLASAQNPNVCLEVSGYANKAGRGTNIRCYTCCNDITQKWTFVKVG